MFYIVHLIMLYLIGIIILVHICIYLVCICHTVMFIKNTCVFVSTENPKQNENNGLSISYI